MSVIPLHNSSVQPLLQVRDLKMHFPVKEGIFMRTGKFNKAVDGVSFDHQPGETLGLVGESGCGKSTLGRSIARLYEPTAGHISFEGTRPGHPLSPRARCPSASDMQMIFQDPMESLNSRHTVGEILEEPFIIHGKGDKRLAPPAVLELLEQGGPAQALRPPAIPSSFPAASASASASPAPSPSSPN
jgi:ABC-type glutathione transport system ATPase component